MTVATVARRPCRATDSPRPGAEIKPGSGSPARPRTGRGRLGESLSDQYIGNYERKFCGARHAACRAVAMAVAAAALPCQNPGVANRDRLTGLDSSFLHLERDSTHMHVAGCMVFEGPAPTHEELLATIERRLHLVPRYRQRLAFVPLNQGRPVWVD